MTTADSKLLLIKKLLNQIEDECEFSLLFHDSLFSENGANAKINSEITDMLQIYFDVIKYILNMADVPNNVHSICIYLAADYQILRVEFYSTQLPKESDKIQVDVRWVDD